MINTPGQISPETQRGRILIENINKNNYNTIVEIGCWNGLGTTLCILKNINAETKFYSLESNKEFYEIAKINLVDFLEKFNLLYGSIVSKSEVELYTSDIILEEHKKIWLKEDIENLEKCEFVLDKLPKKIEMLVLDGGEFSTYLEWTKLKERVTKTVVLDDIRELKTKKIFTELSENKNYKLISFTDEGNGFAIFEKNK